MIHNPLATMIMIIVFGGKEEESKCMLPCFVNTAGLEWRVIRLFWVPRFVIHEFWLFHHNAPRSKQ